MPLGASRLNFLGKKLEAAPAGPANYRTDSYADYLELCVTFNDSSDLDDVAQYINTTLSTSASHSEGTNPSADTGNVKWGAPYNQSYSFTQGDDAISYTLNSSLPSSASGTFVIEGWFRATATGTNWCISAEDTGGRCIFSISGGSAGITTSEGNLNYVNVGDTTGFHHVAFVCDGGTKRTYIDGTSYGAWGSSNTSWSKMSVGQFKNGDANDYDGNIQDLRVYNGTNKGYTGASITTPSSVEIT